jgi:hypothetical protein
VTTTAANPVVMGTDATSPMLPTSVCTISIDTDSKVSTVPVPSPDWLKSIRTGRAAAA